MTKKRYIVKGTDDFFLHIEDTTLTEDKYEGSIYNIYQVVRRLNEQDVRIKQLETDVEYWKQVASQYSNELNVFEHCKQHKTECKDIYWNSD